MFSQVLSVAPKPIIFCCIVEVVICQFTHYNMRLRSLIALSARLLICARFWGTSYGANYLGQYSYFILLSVKFSL